MVRVYREECAKRGQEPVELSGDTDTLSLFGAYQKGDEAAKAAVSLMCDRLGLALSIISGVVDPERYVLGGGVAGALPLFHDELEERFRHYVLSCSADTPIVAAQLGNNAGMFDAICVRLLVPEYQAKARVGEGGGRGKKQQDLRRPTMPKARLASSERSRRQGSRYLSNAMR